MARMQESDLQTSMITDRLQNPDSNYFFVFNQNYDKIQETD